MHYAQFLIHARSAGFATLLHFASAGGALAAQDVVRVTIDQAKVVSVPSNASTLIVGNPIIADVTMLKSNGTMVITGKGFGDTNLILLDAKGEMIDEKTLRVVTGSTALIVQRGTERNSYQCAPHCEPIAALGDDHKQSAEIGATIKEHTELARPSAAK